MAKQPTKAASAARSNGRTSDRLRVKRSITLSPATDKLLVREMHRRGYDNISAAIDDLLRHALDPDLQDDHAEVVLGQLKRLNLRVRRLDRDTTQRDTMLTELVAAGVRLYLAYTPPPPKEQRDELVRTARERFDKLLQNVVRRLAEGETVLEQIPEPEDDGAG